MAMGWATLDVDMGGRSLPLESERWHGHFGELFEFLLEDRAVRALGQRGLDDGVRAVGRPICAGYPRPGECSLKVDPCLIAVVVFGTQLRREEVGTVVATYVVELRDPCRQAAALQAAQHISIAFSQPLCGVF
jgi:hypothetical protein